MLSINIYSFLQEFFVFVVKNIQATIFGFFIVVLILITEYIPLFGFHRYDVIFLAVVCFQLFLLFSKKEGLKEFGVIILFHIVATLMELFKTSSSIGSWAYPLVGTAFFAITTVPLFTGFLYSAVGSYMSRSISIFNMYFSQYPNPYLVASVAIIIYLNFFTQHFIYDFRYVIFIFIACIFWKTKIHFTVTSYVRKMPFILAGLLAAFFVWLVENFASYMGIWLYPNQTKVWQMVSIQKIGSWFLLLIVSFALISLIYQDRLFPYKQDK